MKLPFSTRDPYPSWYRRLPIAVYLPWRNLGTLGVKLGPFYADVYSRRSWADGFPFGLFVSTGKARMWITTKGIKREH